MINTKHYLQIITPLGTLNGKIFDSGDGKLEEAQSLVRRFYTMESFAMENESGELHAFGTELIKNSILLIKNVD